MGVEHPLPAMLAQWQECRRGNIEGEEVEAKREGLDVLTELRHDAIWRQGCQPRTMVSGLETGNTQRCRKALLSGG